MACVVVMAVVIGGAVDVEEMNDDGGKCSTPETTGETIGSRTVGSVERSVAVVAGVLDEECARNFTNAIPPTAADNSATPITSGMSLRRRDSPVASCVRSHATSVLLPGARIEGRSCGAGVVDGIADKRDDEDALICDMRCVA